MKNVIVKKYVNFFGAFIVGLLAFFSVKINTFAAGKHQFQLEAYRCNIAPGADVYNGFEACVNDYNNGSLASFKYAPGANVEPGTYVLMVPRYIYNGTTEVTSYSAKISIDTNFWEVCEDEYGAYYLKSKENYPGGGRGNTVTWTNGIEYSKSSKRYIVQGNDMETNRAGLNKDYSLGYFLLKLKDNVTQGSTMAFTFSDDSTMTNKSAATVNFESVNLSLAVAGDTVSTDSSLKTLTVYGNLSSGNSYEYSLDPSFVSGSVTPKDFNVIIPHEAETVTITAVANSLDIKVPVAISSPKGAGNYSVDVGDNRFTITVVAASGDTTVYNVNVHRLNNDPALSSLTVGGGFTLEAEDGEGFDPGDYNYYVYNVPYATTSIDVSAVTRALNAYIEIDGEKVNNVTKTFDLPKHGKTTGFTNDFINSNFDPKANVITINTCAENCLYNIRGSNNTNRTYYILVYRDDPSNNRFLSELKVDGDLVPDFRKDDYEYDLGTVPYDKTSYNVTAVVEDTDKAEVISGLGTQELVVGPNTITVTVKAEDGSTKDYTIKVKRLNNDSTLKHLNVTSSPGGILSPNFPDSISNRYTYSYDPTVTSIVISAEVNDPNATLVMVDSSNLSITGTNGRVSGTFSTSINKVSITVTSETQGSYVTTYEVLLERGKSTDATLSDLSVNDTTVPGFVSSNKRYSVTVEANVASVNIGAVTNDANARVISGTGSKSLNFGSNTVEVIVRPEISITSGDASRDVSYFIDIERKKYDIATLKDIAVSTDSGPLTQIYDSVSKTYSNFSFDPDVKNYLFRVPFSETTATISAKTTNMYATITEGVNGVITKNLNTGDNDIYIHVTAHDGVATDMYRVTIFRELNNDTSIKQISVKGQSPTYIGDIDGVGVYAITLDNSVDVLAPINVVVKASDDATVDKPTTDFPLDTQQLNEYPFSIIAEDGTEKDYLIRITREKSSDTSMSSVTLTIGSDSSRSCRINGNTCTIEVPVDTTNFSLSATIPSTSTVSPINGTGQTMSASESSKTITLTVTAEDGTTTKDYYIVVERQKSSNNYLKELTVDGELIENFSPGTSNYYIVKDSTVDKIKIGADVLDTGKAKIYLEDFEKNPSATAYDSISDIEYNLDFGNTNNIHLYVKAENGHKMTYTINVTRMSSADATLSELKVSGTLIDSFSPTKFIYTYPNVDYTTTALKIDATATDPNRVSVEGTGLINLVPGDNSIVVTVTAQDGITKLNYTINVYRAKSTDTGVQKITVAGIEAIYNNTLKIYEVTVPNDVTNADSSNVIVTVNNPLVATDPLATYTVVPTSLSTKVVNNVPVTVTSSAGNYKDYTVAVTRAKSSVATLEDITVTNGSFSPNFKPNTFEYWVTVPVDTEAVTIDAVKTDPTSIITAGIGPTTLTGSQMDIPITVISEDGIDANTKTYMIHINRTASNDNTLKTLHVHSFDGTINYPLEDESGNTITFDASTTRYVVHVDGAVDKVRIEAEQNDSRAKILSGTGEKSLNVGENHVAVRVQNEAGYGQDYNITIIRAEKTDANLLSITVDGVEVPGFDKDKLIYNLDEVPFSKTSVEIGATLSDSTDAKITGIGTRSLSTGDNAIRITVTAQDTSITKTYVLNIPREKDNNNKLRLLDVVGYTLEPSFSPDILRYKVTVDEDKTTLNPTEVTALAQSNKASVSKSNTLTLTTDNSKFFNVYVTSEKGEMETYVIEVVRPKSTDATLSDIEIVGGSLASTFEPNKYEYNVTVPYGSSGSIKITGIPNVDTTQVAGDGTFDIRNIKGKTITLRTYAEDGVTNLAYKLNIVEAPSNDASLSSLRVMGYPFDKTFDSSITVYDLGNIPYDVTALDIRAVATNSDSVITYSVDGRDAQANNVVNLPNSIGSKSITVLVTAPDGITKKSYIINYNKTYSTNVYLKTLTSSVGDLGFSKYTDTYDLSIANDVLDIDFEIEQEDANAYYTIDGRTYAGLKTITLQDLPVGITTLRIEVTAQDGRTKKPYTVTIRKAGVDASEDATLKSLSVTDYPFAIGFTPDNHNYEIGEIPYDVDTLTINAVTNADNATIKYYVNNVLSSSKDVTIPKRDGEGRIEVRVTAEDGFTVDRYYIKYSKSVSNNTYLSDLTASVGTLSPSFAKETTNYTLTVPSGTTNLTLVATSEDAKSTITYNGNAGTSPKTINVNNVTNGMSIRIVVNNEDGTHHLTYTVKVNITGQGGDDVPDEITSNDYGHTIDDDNIRTVRLDTTANELKEQLDNKNEYLEIWTNDESSRVGDGEKLATGMIVKLIINNDEKDRKFIVIRGDTTGDGNINLLDAIKILNHVLGNFLEGPYGEAAYVNNDAIINLLDAIKILNHSLGNEFLY